ncbi:hypothetical protein D187_003645 [Cystobacter fuscus DSM 2262]|uniref:Uncharacterized protein n=1 Tax=Cystobacter fuscus (strain ATCC 25194 / DSM 2262 / NBRC 100088 / M29) TaxID=1242864 RepID=S9P380_CYSF2|nr:hypothetical protein D187_003645 [Cystobacter fuscus DSM 2262]
MGQGRYGHTATAPRDGRVLITAGVSNDSQSGPAGTPRGRAWGCRCV